MLTYETLHHVAVSVTDLNRAKHFYGGVLGLKEVARPAFSFDGAWYQAGDRDIHLIVVSDPSLISGNKGRKLDMADGHFALRVTNFRQAQAHLEAAGIPMRVTIGGPTGFPQIHIMDPDRNIIEINAAQS